MLLGDTRDSSMVGSTIEYMCSVHAMASLRHSLFLAKHVVMVLQSSLEGCMVRVDAMET